VTTGQLHQGEWLKKFLEDRCHNKAAVADKSSLSKQGLNNLFNTERIHYETMEKIGRAIDRDMFYEMEKAAAAQKLTVVQDPPASYQKPKNPNDLVEFKFLVDPSNTLKLHKAMQFIKELGQL
jgi:hypothetical protein